MKKTIFTMFTGLLFFFLFIAISVSIVLFYRPFYYWEISRLDIEKTSGLSKEEIVKNYDTLIDYCSPFYTDSLDFPSLPSSREGLIHFKEVKQILTTLFIEGFLSLCVLLWIIFYKKRAEDFQYLHSSALITAFLPFLIFGFLSINFDRTFVLFHKIFFQNDYWIFSPKTDPVITILPQQFFLDAAIFIVVILLLGSLLLEVSYRILTRSNKGVQSQK